MARILGVDLPRDKRVEIGLTYIYGIGLTRAKKICEETGVNPDTRVRDLTEEEVVKLRDNIDANVVSVLTPTLVPARVRVARSALRRGAR